MQTTWPQKTAIGGPKTVYLVILSTLKHVIKCVPIINVYVHASALIKFHEETGNLLLTEN